MSEEKDFAFLVNKLKIPSLCGLIAIVASCAVAGHNIHQLSLMASSGFLALNIGWIIGILLSYRKGNRNFLEVYRFAQFSSGIGMTPIWLLLTVLLPADMIQKSDLLLWSYVAIPAITFFPFIAYLVITYATAKDQNA
jgi:hypothetical protein